MANSEPAEIMDGTTEHAEPQYRSAVDGKVHVGLTHEPLDILAGLARVKSPEAGAVVMFAGKRHPR